MTEKLKTFLFALAVTGCTTATLSTAGDQVMIVDTMSASDLLSYEHVADLQSIGMQTVEDCRNDLRNQAAQKGATIIRITSSEPSYCGVEGFQNGAVQKCVTVYADAFKPKAGK
jgi:hypothetical protein